jgi:regulator of protease activity HflC (stomatin/prohibitin superfamily)
MSFSDRWYSTQTHGTQSARYINWWKVGRDVGCVVLAWIVIAICWPFYTVPVGSRGVITQFGKIVGIQPEGLAVLPPWQALTLFSIRAEQADIDKADGSTSDTQPVFVSLTVRYSISPDKVAEATWRGIGTGAASVCSRTTLVSRGRQAGRSRGRPDEARLAGVLRGL